MKSVIVFITLLFFGLLLAVGGECQFAHTSLFGDVEVRTSDQYYTPMKESAASRRSVFRTFRVASVENSTQARLGSLQVAPGKHVLAKYDSQVNDYVWATAIDSGNTCYDSWILPSCDSKSVITLMGFCRGDFVQFNITGINHSYSVVIKYDVNGTYVWHKMIPSLSIYAANIACEQDNEDVIYLSGSFNYIVELDNVILLGDSNSAFVAKLDQDAWVVWAKNTTGTRPTSLTSDDQYVYLGGTTFSGEAYIGDTFLNSSSNGGLVLAWFDKNVGEVARVTPFALGSTDGNVRSISVGTNGTLYIAGFVFMNTIFGNTTIYAERSCPSMFVVQYNRTSGEIFPERVLNGVFDMKVDRNGSIHLSGQFNCSTMIQEMYECQAPSYPGFYAELASSGEWLSFLTINANMAEAIYLSVASDGYISILGDAVGPTLQFSKGPTFNMTSAFYLFFAEVLFDGNPIESLNVVPNRGAMLYDYFVFSMSGELFSTYRFGFFDGKGQRVFLSGWTNDRVLNTTMSITGNFTVFAQGLSTHGNIMEWTSRVEVYQGEASKVAQALTEQENKLNQLNGTLLEQQLTDYTHALVDSIQIISSNRTTQLLSNLLNLIESKQGELSGSATLETVKSISQQYSFLSENSTIQASNILTKIMKNNNTSIADSIVVAHNIANVMISSNSSQSQKKSFTSMISVLTEKIRGNMTEGQTSELSLPYLETVITKVNQWFDNHLNTTIVVKQPSYDARNNDRSNVTIVIPTSLLSQSNASFIQCEAIANPPDPYSTKCNTKQVSPTISTMLFTDNQQLIQTVDSSSRVSIESSVTVPNTLNSTMTDLYKYACKYLDRNSNLWKNDSSVCHTGVTSLNNSTNEAISVRCQCSQPVTHAVSLDYVQSSDGLDESNIGVGQVCTNPCGCSQTDFGKTSKKKGMKAYGIALIILACLTILVIVIAAFALVVILLFRATLKRGSTIKNTEKKEAPNEIESRFGMMYK